MTEEIEDIKQRVVRHPDAVDLYIKRMPKKIRDLFVEVANKDFVGDYGMCFKHVVEDYFVNGERLNEIFKMLSEHEERLYQLESQSNKDNPEEVSGVRGHLKKRTEEQKK